jgi:tetratricopeptide (TPR) repeat protein
MRLNSRFFLLITSLVLTYTSALACKDGVVCNDPNCPVQSLSRTEDVNLSSPMSESEDKNQISPFEIDGFSNEVRQKILSYLSDEDLLSFRVAWDMEGNVDQEVSGRYKWIDGPDNSGISNFLHEKIFRKAFDLFVSHVDIKSNDKKLVDSSQRSIDLIRHTSILKKQIAPLLLQLKPNSAAYYFLKAIDSYSSSVEIYPQEISKYFSKSIDLLKEQAKQGSIESSDVLALLYLNGIYVNKDEMMAHCILDYAEKLLLDQKYPRPIQSKLKLHYLNLKKQLSNTEKNSDQFWKVLESMVMTGYSSLNEKINLAKGYFQMGNYSRSAEIFDQALQDPWNILENKAGAAIAHFYAGSYVRSAQIWDEVLQSSKCTQEHEAWAAIAHAAVRDFR